MCSIKERSTLVDLPTEPTPAPGHGHCLLDDPGDGGPVASPSGFLFNNCILVLKNGLDN